jgi:N-acyl amino acid synthase of PEP-CTERM/exosortase system
LKQKFHDLSNGTSNDPTPYIGHAGSMEGKTNGIIGPLPGPKGENAVSDSHFFAQEGLLATATLRRLFKSGGDEDLTSPSRQVSDAQMPWLADDGDLAGLPAALIQQTTKSFAGRMSFALYRRHFEIIRADTPELRDLVYLLRFQVYAHEHGFEKPEDHPEDREKDDYDERSMHILLRHRRSGVIVGTARLVLPDADDPASSFPVQTVSNHPILQDPQVAAHAVEFSRLAISRERLKRCHVGSSRRATRFPEVFAKQLVPYLSVGLIAGVMELAAENGYPVMFAMMEPFLIRNLNRIGIEIPFVDAPVEYHGLRVPCALPSLYDACAGMKKRDRSAWEIVTNRGRTQELALIAQTSSERARRAVARASRMAKLPAPVVLRAPGTPARTKGPVVDQVSAVVGSTVSRSRRRRQLCLA